MSDRPGPVTPPITPETPRQYDYEDFQALQGSGLAKRVPSGSIRVSKRRLESPPEEDDGSVAAADARDSSPVTAKEVLVPPTLQCEDFFQWIGLEELTAKSCFQKWTDSHKNPDSRPHPVDIAKDYIWRHYLGHNSRNTIEIYRLQIDAELRNCFYDPDLKHVIASQDIVYWLFDTFDIRTAVLLDIYAMSKERANGRKTPKKPKTGQPGPSSSKSAGESKGHKKSMSDTLTEMQALSLQGQSAPTVSTLPKEPEIKEEHVLMWKGISLSRTLDLLNDKGELVDIEVIASFAPGDFNGMAAGYYFTPQKEIAEDYAWWARKRIDMKTGNVCLISMQVPRELMHQFKSHSFKGLDDDWKKVVWWSRRVRSVGDELTFDIGSQEMLYGDICCNTDQVVKDLKSWKDLTQWHTMRVNRTGPQGKQYFFLYTTHRRLQNACKNTVALHPSAHSFQRAAEAKVSSK